MVAVVPSIVTEPAGEPPCVQVTSYPVAPETGDQVKVAVVRVRVTVGVGAGKHSPQEVEKSE